MTSEVTDVSMQPSLQPQLKVSEDELFFSHVTPGLTRDVTETTSSPDPGSSRKRRTISVKNTEPNLVIPRRFNSPEILPRSHQTSFHPEIQDE